MRIDHLALWADNLDLLQRFYSEYFGFRCGPLYENPVKGFRSYFLTAPDGQTRIELMHVAALCSDQRQGKPFTGYAHMAISVGSKEQVDALTARLRADGYAILSEPRTTGDGYYESTIADPEGNYLEITV